MSSRPASEEAGPDRGILVVVSGPSGAGKSTLIRKVMDERGGMAFSISATTRSPRSGEVDGRDYVFVSEAEFDGMAAAGELLEHAVVHGHKYGTPKSGVDELLDKGVDVVLDIDIQGARQVETKAPGAVFVFVMPSSPQVLAQRLRARGTDTEDEIERRLRTAKDEVAYATRPESVFEYLVLNDDLEVAASELMHVIGAEKVKLARRLGESLWRSSTSKK